MKIPQPGTHLDHLLRQTRVHHMQLSSMADLKANMLLTAASVVLTLSVAYIADPALRWPVLLLIGFCLLTVILAAYAVMPKLPVTLGPGAHKDVHSPDFNLLFFGDFARLSYDEFVEAMEEVMSDPEHAYEAQLKEIYSLGQFLAAKKYRFVRLAYLAFIAGLVSSAVALLVSTTLAG